MKRDKNMEGYPEPICQDCSKRSDIYEEVSVGFGVIELWSYCRACDLETFHKIAVRPFNKLEAFDEKEKS